MQKTKPISSSERRRMKALADKHLADLMETDSRAFSRGHATGTISGAAKARVDVELEKTTARSAGLKDGMKIAHADMLQHAGRLFEERRDADAVAVREVHRLLVEAAK